MAFFQKSKKINDLEGQVWQLQKEIERLNLILQQTGAGDASRIQALTLQLQNEHQNYLQYASNEKQTLETQLQSLQQQLNLANQALQASQQQKAELDAIYNEATEYLDAGLVEFANPAKSSVHYSKELEQIKAEIKQMIRGKVATLATNNFTFNNSQAKGRKFVSDMSAVMLRAYNVEAENCVLTVKAGNGEAARKRLNRAYEQVSKLGKMIELSVNPHYHDLRLKELNLTLLYQQAVKAEKEAERERKAQLREEKKAQAELEAERKKLAKEQAHYQNLLKALMQSGSNEEIAEAESKLREIDSQIESVDFRAANIRAGYVYVISNIGSFGDRMVKIGMTRRLDPMDRIRELSDASVPFNFDVHALFFTEDAVGVENELHKIFAHARVNLVNQRREFFEVTPAEVKEQLEKIAGNLLEFVDVPEAEQYRQSIAIRENSNIAM